VTLLRVDGAPADADWIDLADDAPVPDGAAVIVSAARLAVARGAIPAALLGVRIGPADRVETIARDLECVDLVVVTFAKFRDGRGYSTARLLRERCVYRGDLRAEGDVFRDQLAFMIRCGFSSFALKDRAPQAALDAALRRFSVVYQPAADGAPPIWRRRAERVRIAAE
jgi:uncharacterized protein (DUF934 family)